MPLRTEAWDGRPRSSRDRPKGRFKQDYEYLCSLQQLCPVFSSRGNRSKLEGSKLLLKLDRLSSQDTKPLFQALKEDLSLRDISICINQTGRIRNQYYINSSQGLADLTNCLSVLLRKNTKIRSLRLEGISLNVTHFQRIGNAISRASSLITLTISHTHLNESILEKLCPNISANSTLQHLNLSNCHIDAAGIVHLAKILKFQQNLRDSLSWHTSLRETEPDLKIQQGIVQLNLSSCPNIGDEGIAILIDALMDNTWLRELIIVDCNLTSISLSKFMSLLSVNPSLVKVDFGQVPFAGDFLFSLFELFSNLFEDSEGFKRFQQQLSINATQLQSSKGIAARIPTTESFKPSKSDTHSRSTFQKDSLENKSESISTSSYTKSTRSKLNLGSSNKTSQRSETSSSSTLDVMDLFNKGKNRLKQPSTEVQSSQFSDEARLKPVASDDSTCKDEEDDKEDESESDNSNGSSFNVQNTTVDDVNQRFSGLSASSSNEANAMPQYTDILEELEAESKRIHEELESLLTSTSSVNTSVHGKQILDDNDDADADEIDEKEEFLEQQLRQLHGVLDQLGLPPDVDDEKSISINDIGKS